MAQRLIDMKNEILLLLFTIILFSMNVQATVMIPYNQVGANWTYSAAGCSTSYKTSVLSEVQPNLYNVETGCEGQSSTFNYYNYATDWVELPYFLTSNINYTLTPAQIILPYNLSVGQTWTQTISESSAYEVVNYDYTSTITSAETLSVPAGTFSCYVVVTDKSGISTYTTWWAETIGIIQIEYSPISKLELLTYYIPLPITPSPFPTSAPSLFPTATNIVNSITPSTSISGYPGSSVTSSCTTSSTPTNTPTNTPTEGGSISPSPTASLYNNYYYYPSITPYLSPTTSYYNNDSSSGGSVWLWVLIAVGVIVVILFIPIIFAIIGGVIVYQLYVKKPNEESYSLVGNQSPQVDNSLDPHVN